MTRSRVRIPVRTAISCAILLSGAVAAADEPAPPAEETPAPATPPSEAPAAPLPTPAPEATTPAPVPPPAVSTESKAPPLTNEEMGLHAAAREPAHRPTIALEISGAGAYVANPYVEYKGWTLETGAGKGGRIEANLIGIQLGYELTTMSNQQACAASCLTGNFGSTKFNVLDLGYRFRFQQLGPVRPFVTMSLGGVLASSGDWGMSSSKTVFGGQGRAGLGIEVPILDRFFASATLAYRIIVTENPLRDPALEKTNKVFIGGDTPNGDYAEDVHLVSGYVGFGVEL